MVAIGFLGIVIWADHHFANLGFEAAFVAVATLFAEIVQFLASVVAGSLVKRIVQQTLGVQGAKGAWEQGPPAVTAVPPPHLE